VNLDVSRTDDQRLAGDAFADALYHGLADREIGSG
jgi:hypothetical protein